MACTSLAASISILTIAEDGHPTTPQQSSTYIDEQLIGCGAISQAGLYNYPDGTCVATSGNVMKSSITFQSCFERPTSFFTSGVSFNGVEYMTSRANGRTVFAQKGASGIIACKTKKSVVVGVYNDQADPGIALQAVESLAEFLRSRE